MSRAIGLSLILVASTLPGNSANPASFDCRQARLPAEQAICNDHNLGRLDEQTAGLYFLIVGSGGPADTITMGKTAQHNFLKTRNACGSDQNCLVDAYTSQLMLLKSIKDDLGL